jgi:hypothetical protein
VSAAHPDRIDPEPDAEEAVAIAAALVTLHAAAPDGSSSTESTWRFSGRWWSRPVAQRRSRPG